MALRTLVKMSSVNNLSDARYTAGMGVDLMGFTIDPGEQQYLDSDAFNAITSWISGVKIVGEIENGAIDLNQLTENYPIDYLQVPAETGGQLASGSTIPVIVKVENLTQDSLASVFNQYGKLPAWYLLEPESSMSDSLLQWCLQQAADHPLILGSNITMDNLDQLVESDLKGLSFKGGQEIRPGYRDFDELADLLEALELSF